MNLADTLPPSPAQMQRHDAARLREACRCLWPDRQAAGLAALVGCPKSTARAWLSGHRRPPPSTLHRVIHALHERAAICSTVEAFLQSELAAREREPIRRTGWAEIRDRDGSGILRDGRWRGGRQKANQFPPA